MGEVESLAERIARIEQQVETLSDIDLRLRAIEMSLSKYQGMWGAIMLIGGAIWAFTTFAWEHIRVKLGT